MKTLTWLLVIAINMSISCFGATKLNRKTSTESDYRNVLSEIIAAPNSKVAIKLFNESSFEELAFVEELSELHHYADDLLAQKGVGARWLSYITWPKVSAIARRMNGADVCYSNCIAVAEKYKQDIYLSRFASKGASVEELIPCFNEIIALPAKCYFSHPLIDHAKRGLQRAAVVGIRKALRKQGKSFVSSDGKNPCEEYMNRLNVALNAPRFQGLNKWLEDLGFEVRIDEGLLPSNSEIESLKDAIFYGEKELNEHDRAILYICLGVEGFNAFAKKYNGE